MDYYIGEIRLFGFQFTPKDWMPCNGQILEINQYNALFALLGTTYGGDGRTTFALPDLRGRVVMGQGTGSGLKPRTIGQQDGQEEVSLSINQIPSHSHDMDGEITVSLNVNNDSGEENTPNGNYIAGGSNIFVDEAGTNQNLNGLNVTNSLNNASTGDGQSHNNLQPYLVSNYCICIQGTFPPRN